MHESASPPQYDAPRPSANPNEHKSEESGPQYRLRTTHFIEGRLVNPGTIVGAGTPYPMENPSQSMEGANEAGKQKINEFHNRLYGKDAPWHDSALQKDVEQDLEDQKKQREEEKGAEPVSHQQAKEMDKEWKGDPPPVTATPAPIVGQQAGPGVAVPRIPQEQPRVEKPLEEQLPKVG
jgi:hypothetical protein